MTLRDFQIEAQRRGHYYDNSASASEHWTKTWGLTYHSLLWFYKEYEVGNMKWKGGQVRLRHGSYRSVDCYIDGELVSEYRFKKALETFEFPPLTDDEQRYIAERQKQIEEELRAMRARRFRRKRKTDNSLQLSLNFAMV